MLKLSGLPEDMVGAPGGEDPVVSRGGVCPGGKQVGAFWRDSERGSLVCVWERGCVSERDVCSGVASSLNRHHESRAQFGSALHFPGTFHLSSLIFFLKILFIYS